MTEERKPRRYIPLHLKEDKSNLEEFLDYCNYLLHRFEARLLRNVKDGNKKMPSAEELAEFREAFERAEEEGDRQNAGHILSVGLYKHLIALLDEYADLRLKPGSLLPETEAIERLMLEAYSMVEFTVRQDGEPDRDRVIREMLGEPNKLLAVMRPDISNSSNEILDKFFNDRFRKLTEAWKEIDQIKTEVEALIRTKHLGKKFKEKFAEFVELAKTRSEVMSRDHISSNEASQEYKAAVDGLKSERERWRTSMLMERIHERQTIDVINRAVELIYDMATIRGARKESTRTLVEEIKHGIENSQSTVLRIG